MDAPRLYVYGYGTAKLTVPGAGFTAIHGYAVGKAWVTTDWPGALRDLVLFCRDAIDSLGREHRRALIALQQAEETLGDLIVRAPDGAQYFILDVDSRSAANGMEEAPEPMCLSRSGRTHQA